MPLKIVRQDITKMDTEAIVNTANENAVVGSGCDTAVYQAAGYEKLLNYRREYIGHVEEGEVFITPGFDLQAKYIIHAVSPLYRGGDQGEEAKLRACYRKSLLLAKEHGIRSIAFPLIASGGFGYPREEGMRIAVDEINAFLLGNEMNVVLVVFGSDVTRLGRKIYPDLESYIDQNYVEQAEMVEYACVSRELESSQRRWPEFGRGLRRAGKAAPSSAAPSSATPNSAEPMVGSAKPLGDFSISDFESDESSFETFDESKLDERMRHLADTFSEYLMYLIQEKGMKNAEVWKRAIVDKKTFSKLKNNPDYHPNKLTALCLCVGAKLNLDQSKDLLARAGYALSPCDKTDIIFTYFIENEIYDMIELDIQLEEHGLPCIIV